MPLEVRSLAEWEADGIPGLLSVVIPAHNEEGHIAATVRELRRRPARRRASRTRSSSSTTTASDRHRADPQRAARRDSDAPLHQQRAAQRVRLRGARRPAAFRGDAVAIVMADGSDRPGRSRRVLPQDAGGLRLRLRIALHARRADRRLSVAEADDEPAGELLHPHAVLDVLQRRDQRLQAVPADRSSPACSRCSPTTST